MGYYERIVKVTGAYDKRSSDPDKNYGYGGCQVIFVVKTPRGAVSFTLGTNWYLPHMQREFEYDPPPKSYYRTEPRGYDLGYHSFNGFAPDREWGTKMDDCWLADNHEACYYDGSTLNAENIVPEFLRKGTDFLWPYLEDYHRGVFGDPPINIGAWIDAN